MLAAFFVALMEVQFVIVASVVIVATLTSASRVIYPSSVAPTKPANVPFRERLKRRRSSSPQVFIFNSRFEAFQKTTTTSSTATATATVTATATCLLQSDESVFCRYVFNVSSAQQLSPNWRCNSSPLSLLFGSPIADSAQLSHRYGNLFSLPLSIYLS